MALREALMHVAASYAAARSETFAGNAVAAYLRNDAAEAVAVAVANPHFKVTGSPGQGQWAEVPWIAVFDPNVTSSATNGVYVVYLFVADLTAVHLVQAQGTTAIREEFGRGTFAELGRRCALMRARLPERLPRFSDQPIKLGGTTTLAKDYEPSSAFGVTYDLANLPAEDVLIADLREIVRLYTILNARGGIDTIEDAADEEEQGATTTVIERRRYRLHRKIDRNPKAAKAAKKVHGHICQGCSFSFATMYGPLGEGYIEAHHLTPLSELPEDVPVPQDPKTDFAVLCANCHRMMHRKGAPKTLAELRALGEAARFIKPKE